MESCNSVLQQHKVGVESITSHLFKISGQFWFSCHCHSFVFVFCKCFCARALLMKWHPESKYLSKTVTKIRLWNPYQLLALSVCTVVTVTIPNPCWKSQGVMRHYTNYSAEEELWKIDCNIHYSINLPTKIIYCWQAQADASKWHTGWHWVEQSKESWFLENSDNYTAFLMAGEIKMQDLKENMSFLP